MKIQEFLGYSLLHWDIPFDKAMLVVGPANLGKSTLMDILNLLHNDDAVSHVTPQELSEERFAAHQLYESWVNTRNDILNETVQNVGKVKGLIAGNELKVEKESPELLNWSIEGFHRLMEQGGFSGDRSPEETEGMWSRWSSSVKRFVHECIEFTGNNDDNTLGKDVVLEVFDEWSERRGMPSASKKTMTEVITRNSKAGHTRYGGSDSSGYYKGVCWSETGGIISNYIADIGNIDEEDVKEVLVESAN
jgi:phage/plasmid-associated DNA primase